MEIKSRKKVFIAWIDFYKWSVSKKFRWQIKDKNLWNTIYKQFSSVNRCFQTSILTVACSLQSFSESARLFKLETQKSVADLKEQLKASFDSNREARKTQKLHIADEAVKLSEVLK